MDDEILDKLVTQMRFAIHENDLYSRQKITNPQYSSMYFNVFFEALKKNNGNPVHYDVFGDRLWIKLGEDVNKFQDSKKNFQIHGMLGLICMLI